MKRLQIVIGGVLRGLMLLALSPLLGALMVLVFLEECLDEFDDWRGSKRSVMDMILRRDTDKPTGNGGA